MRPGGTCRGPAQGRLSPHEAPDPKLWPLQGEVPNPRLTLHLKTQQETKNLQDPNNLHVDFTLIPFWTYRVK